MASNLLQGFVFGSASIVCWIAFAVDAPKQPATAAGTDSVAHASPYTNSAPVSVFHAVEGRDPFMPDGYKKPKPNDPVRSVKVELTISGMSFSETGPLATTKDGQVLEVGGTYTYRSKDGKTSVNYKVLSISDDGVTIQYNDTEETFKQESSDLDKFKEKEESP